MKKIIKDFCFRGLLAMGFGPIIYSIIILIIYLVNKEQNTTFLVSGIDLFKGVTSTTLMAFLIAGASVIWQVERIGLIVQIIIHGAFLYLSYLVTYLCNNWISTNAHVLLIFTLSFIVGYLLIWLFIYLIEKEKIKNLNKSLHKK